MKIPAIKKTYQDQVVLDLPEMEFEEGLRRSFAWFTENRESIVFKANVDKNLYEIIAELSV